MFDWLQFIPAADDRAVNDDIAYEQIIILTVTLHCNIHLALTV